MASNGLPRFERLGTVRNFAWVEQNLLARGEQPRGRDTYSALHSAGVRRVISLRQDGPAQKVVGEIFPEYSAERERRDCSGAGLSFTRVSSIDLTALPPALVAEVLGAIDGSIRRAEPVFVHCTAGVGRTGVIAAAWMMTRGWSSTNAAESFLSFCDALYEATGLLSGGQEAYFERNGIHEHWWSINRIAEALELPTPIAHRPYIHPFPPEHARKDQWSKLYRESLAPWRNEI